MTSDNTITIQEVRKDPLGFLRRINDGKTLTVIYRSRPFATVTSADTSTPDQPKSTKRLLEFAELSRASSKVTLDTAKTYKQMYAEDMAQKYGIS